MMGFAQEKEDVGQVTRHKQDQPMSRPGINQLEMADEGSN